MYAPAKTTFPFIIVGRDEFTVEDYIGASPTGLSDLRIADYTITVWAESTVETEDISELVITAAMFGRKHESTIVIQSQDFTGGADGVAPPLDGSQEAVNTIDLSFVYNYQVNQPVPTP